MANKKVYTSKYCCDGCESFTYHTEDENGVWNGKYMYSHEDMIATGKYIDGKKQGKFTEKTVNDGPIPYIVLEEFYDKDIITKKIEYTYMTAWSAITEIDTKATTIYENGKKQSFVKVKDKKVIARGSYKDGVLVRYFSDYMTLENGIRKTFSRGKLESIKENNIETGFYPNGDTKSIAIYTDDYKYSNQDGIVCGSYSTEEFYSDGKIKSKHFNSKDRETNESWHNNGVEELVDINGFSCYQDENRIPQFISKDDSCWDFENNCKWVNHTRFALDVTSKELLGV